MIGNDVVDLGDAESRAAGRHARFDDRVFAAVERELIAASPLGERARWVIWAAKESTYKAARKEDPRTVFAPRRFLVRFESATVRSEITLGASVRVGDRRFRVDVAVDADHVHAVAYAAADPPDPIWTAVGSHAGVAPTDAVRRLVVATLSRGLGLPPDDLAIRRDGRIPTLWLRGRRSLADLSLSHHGRFVAFACGLAPRRGVL